MIARIAAEGSTFSPKAMVGRGRETVVVDALAAFDLRLIRKREQGLFVPRRITASCLLNVLFKRQRRSFTI